MGHQETVEEMRAEKAEKYIELKNKKKEKEYEEWFLRYRPLDGKGEDNESNKTNKTNKTKSIRKKKRKTRKRKGLFF